MQPNQNIKEKNSKHQEHNTCYISIGYFIYWAPILYIHIYFCIFLGSKITAVTAAMKLKDACFLEGKNDS